MNRENHVFSRTLAEGEIIGDRNYNLVLGMMLFWGFGVNYLIVSNVDFMVTSSSSLILFIVGYFVAFFIGSTMMRRSNNPVISFIGYNLIVIAFGLVLDIVLSQYDPKLIQNAMLTTAIVTVAMMLLGVMYPEFFQKIQGVLTGALIVSIIAQLILVFLFRVDLGIIDWIIALSFCGYIGFDWGRANRIPKTVDNAIDSAAALYIDIVNLFLRILRILGRRN